MKNNKHIENYNAAAEEYGLTEWEGEEYALLQDAYLDGTHEDPHYSSTATDKKGNTYEVRWEIDPRYNPECGDESEACDWWNPSSIRLIDRAE